jgi:hypothetical protein
LLEELLDRAHCVCIASNARDVNPYPALDDCVKNAQAPLDSAFSLRTLVRNRFVVSFALARGRAFDARCLLSLVCSGRCAGLLALRGWRRSISDGDWRPPKMMRGQPVQCLPDNRRWHEGRPLQDAQLERVHATIVPIRASHTAKLERALVVRRGEAASFELLPEPIEQQRLNRKRSAIPDLHRLIPSLTRIVPDEGTIRDSEKLRFRHNIRPGHATQSVNEPEPSRDEVPDLMEEVHLLPPFSVTERRNQRVQLRVCRVHVAVIQSFDYPFKPLAQPVSSLAVEGMNAMRTLNWDELEPGASEAFRIWMSESDLQWAKEAWNLLVKGGLCSYENEGERHVVIGRFLALCEYLPRLVLHRLR